MSESSEERGLLAAVVADPGADLPRLVYADWLDEHDSPERAELIRVQCELARRPDRPAELLAREAELVAVGELWRVPGLSGVQHCRRGFADGIDTSADALLALPPGRLEFVPVRWLRLRVADKRIEEVARLPVWPRLTTLMLNTNNFGSASRLARFFGAADCARLTTLGLGNNVMRSYSVEELVRLPVLTQLEELILEGNPIGDDGAAILAAGPRLPNLKRLNLRSNELPHYDCLHPPGVVALANSSNFPALEWLDLSRHHILDSGLEALAESPLAQQLVTLLVARNDIGLSAGTDGIAALTQADWPNLRGLDLSGNAVSVGSVARLLNWRRLPKLEWLNLRDTELTPELEDDIRAAGFGARIELD